MDGLADPLTFEYLHVGACERLSSERLPESTYNPRWGHTTRPRLPFPYSTYLPAPSKHPFVGTNGMLLLLVLVFDYFLGGATSSTPLHVGY